MSVGWVSDWASHWLDILPVSALSLSLVFYPRSTPPAVSTALPPNPPARRSGPSPKHDRREKRQERHRERKRQTDRHGDTETLKQKKTETRRKERENEKDIIGSKIYILVQLESNFRITV